MAGATLPNDGVWDAWEVVTPPASEPCTTAELKAHMRVLHSDEDDEIDIFGKRGRLYVEKFCRRQIVTATYNLTCAEWPSGRVIWLPLPPLASVTHVKYYDATDTQQTYSADNYNVITSGEPGYLQRAASASWPVLYDRADAIEIQFVCGQAVASVPEDIKSAVCLLAAHWFKHREAVQDQAHGAGSLSPLPLAIADLLWPYKQVEFVS